MKKTWPLSQILRLSSIAVIIIAVVVTIILTNITLRSVERNLPNTLIKELVSLDIVLEHLSEVVTAAQITATDTNSENFDRLTKKVQKILNETLYGFDFDVTMVRLGLMNLMMHGVDAPHIDYRDTLSN